MLPYDIFHCVINRWPPIPGQYPLVFHISFGRFFLQRIKILPNVSYPNRNTQRRLDTQKEFPKNNERQTF